MVQYYKSPNFIIIAALFLIFNKPHLNGPKGIGKQSRNGEGDNSLVNTVYWTNFIELVMFGITARTTAVWAGFNPVYLST